MLKMFQRFLKEEDGINTVEIVIIIAILIGVAFIFKKAIIQFVDGVFDKVFEGGSDVSDVPATKDRSVN